MSNGNKVLNLVDPLDVNTAKAGPPSCLSNPLLQCCFSGKGISDVCTGCTHAILYMMRACEADGRIVLLVGI